ncbi:hypothetical protein Q6A90_04865 [Aliarcobacter skirrowii]|uniref:hypothetical protein n=1 Tax=Aliarcobacter skirrowii TaxID=28200 RepID=UPI0029A2985F|nr:hypothetical protein [Aliarcobacter skirrowii]MDX4061693.1 hypothetical protein [Aliarcobacter skirrowii]
MEQKQAIEILATYIPIYPKAFEELFKLYGNDNGNKQRAYEVFQRKWEKVDLEALKTVIKMYLVDMDYIKCSDYKPHFENFLHSNLESYILKKQKEI